MYASYRGHLDVIKLLLENGANINAQTSKGLTALFYAENESHEHIIKFLKSKGGVNKKQLDSEGCFITTAICLTQGKSDNCYELTQFRWLRDQFLINQPNGKKIIEEYYKIAPKIVNKINCKQDKL